MHKCQLKNFLKLFQFLLEFLSDFFSSTSVFGGAEISGAEVCKCTNANNANNGGSTSDLDHHFLPRI